MNPPPQILKLSCAVRELASEGSVIVFAVPLSELREDARTTRNPKAWTCLVLEREEAAQIDLTSRQGYGDSAEAAVRDLLAKMGVQV